MSNTLKFLMVGALALSGVAALDDAAPSSSTDLVSMSVNANAAVVTNVSTGEVAEVDDSTKQTVGMPIKRRTVDGEKSDGRLRACRKLHQLPVVMPGELVTEAKEDKIVKATANIATIKADAKVAKDKLETAVKTLKDKLDGAPKLADIVENVRAEADGAVDVARQLCTADPSTIVAKLGDLATRGTGTARPTEAPCVKAGDRCLLPAASGQLLGRVGECTNDTVSVCAEKPATTRTTRASITTKASNGGIVPPTTKASGGVVIPTIKPSSGKRDGGVSGSGKVELEGQVSFDKFAPAADGERQKLDASTLAAKCADLKSKFDANEARADDVRDAAEAAAEAAKAEIEARLDLFKSRQMTTKSSATTPKPTTASTDAEPETTPKAELENHKEAVTVLLTNFKSACDIDVKGLATAGTPAATTAVMVDASIKAQCDAARTRIAGAVDQFNLRVARERTAEALAAKRDELKDLADRLEAHSDEGKKCSALAKTLLGDAQASLDDTKTKCAPQLKAVADAVVAAKADASVKTALKARADKSLEATVDVKLEVSELKLKDADVDAIKQCVADQRAKRDAVAAKIAATKDQWRSDCPHFSLRKRCIRARARKFCLRAEAAVAGDDDVVADVKTIAALWKAKLEALCGPTVDASADATADANSSSTSTMAAASADVKTEAGKQALCAVFRKRLDAAVVEKPAGDVPSSSEPMTMVDGVAMRAATACVRLHDADPDVEEPTTTLPTAPTTTTNPAMSKKRATADENLDAFVVAMMSADGGITVTTQDDKIPAGVPLVDDETTTDDQTAFDSVDFGGSTATTTTKPATTAAITDKNGKPVNAAAPLVASAVVALLAAAFAML